MYRYRWENRQATLVDSVRLAPTPISTDGRQLRRPGTTFAAGIAPSPDGRWLYLADNLGDLLALLDAASWRVVQRLAAGRYLYAVVAAPNGTVYVSAWGGDGVSTFRPTGDAGAPLASSGTIVTGRHSSALFLNVAGTRLFVAEGDANAVAIFALDSITADISPNGPPPTNHPSTSVAITGVSPCGGDRLVGRVPAG